MNLSRSKVQKYTWPHNGNCLGLIETDEWRCRLILDPAIAFISMGHIDFDS